VRLLDRLSRFLEWSKKNKIWSLTGAAFFPILWFVTEFWMSIPAHLTERATSSLRFETQLREYDRLAALNDAIKEGLSAYLTASKYYQDHLAGQSGSAQIPREVLAQGIKAATDARYGAAHALGMIQGISFQDTRLEGYRAASQADVAQIARLVANLENFFVLLSAGRKQEARQALGAVDSPETTQQVTAMGARATEFGETLSLVSQEYMIDVAEQTAKEKVFIFKVWAALAGFVYEVAFISIALWTIFVRPRKVAQHARKT
jgi:hypothetical protein